MLVGIGGVGYLKRPKAKAGKAESAKTG